MQVQLLKAKLHRVEVTQSDLNYEGSMAIDEEYLEMAGILPYEKILIVNNNNGSRIETYAIPAPRGSRTFCLNGAAARSGLAGDRGRQTSAQSRSLRQSQQDCEDKEITCSLSISYE